MTIPKVFVSYSHDSQEHKKWVLDLATRLRNTGIDAALDQWELRPGDDLPLFMERNLKVADRVIMICTSTYVEKANSGKGGVGYEKMIVTSDLLKEIDSNKVIPIIRQHASRGLPTFLKSKLYIDFSLADQYEFSFDELVRTIHNSPLYKKPDIGNNPFQPISEVAPEKAGDPILELMRIVVSDFEEGENWTNYTSLVGRFGASRILLDIVISDAVKKGLVTLDSEGDLYLSDKGKHFAVEHRLARGIA